MSDLRTLIVHRIDRSLESISTIPDMWGSPESQELLVLLLLEMRTVATRSYALNERPSGLRDAYDAFIREAFGENAPAMLVSEILHDLGRQDELPAYLSRFAQEFEQRIPLEDPFKDSDLLLEIEVKPDPDQEQVPFARICKYYEHFQQALFWLARRAGKGRSLAQDVAKKATEYPIPEIKVVPRIGAPTLVQITLAQPHFGTMDWTDNNLSVPEQSVKLAVAEAAKMIAWARSGEGTSALREDFPLEDERRAVAVHAMRMLPEEGFSVVRLGGRLLGTDNLVEMRPEQTQKMLDVLREGQAPKAFAEFGTVRAVDLDQKWFRIRYTTGKNRTSTIKCYPTDRPDLLDKASKALAAKRRITVEGDIIRAPQAQPLVIVTDVQPKAA